MASSATSIESETHFGAAVPWILRVGLAACFIGHGCLGLLLFKGAVGAWPAYFAVVGISHDLALKLMPWVGGVDVVMGLVVLFHPFRALIIYMTAWCVWTALLRPLAGESVWELMERAGNYGVPLALVFLLGGGGLWGRAVFREELPESRRNLGSWVLRLTTVLLLLGHGALLALVHKPAFIAQYNFIGLPGAVVEPWAGAFEWLLALAVLLKPDRWLLVTVLVWKLATAALSPIAGSPISIWVFIEHGGSYAAPLALLFLFPRRSLSPVNSVATAA
jgi:hypothetical protein